MRKVNIFLALILLALSFLITPSTALPLSVANPLRDMLFYFNDPSIMTLLSAFGNFIWGLFFAPWNGGQAMVEAQVDYNYNPGLYNFLEYSVQDFYVLRMQDKKLEWATRMGY